MAVFLVEEVQEEESIREVHGNGDVEEMVSEDAAGDTPTFHVVECQPSDVDTDEHLHELHDSDALRQPVRHPDPHGPAGVVRVHE